LSKKKRKEEEEKWKRKKGKKKKKKLGEGTTLVLFPSHLCFGLGVQISLYNILDAIDKVSPKRDLIFIGVGFVIIFATQTVYQMAMVSSK
jgi:hypothetical protein